MCIILHNNWLNMSLCTVEINNRIQIQYSKKKLYEWVEIIVRILTFITDGSTRPCIPRTALIWLDNPVAWRRYSPIQTDAHLCVAVSILITFALALVAGVAPRLIDCVMVPHRINTTCKEMFATTNHFLPVMPVKYEIPKLTCIDVLVGFGSAHPVQANNNNIPSDGAVVCWSEDPKDSLPAKGPRNILSARGPHNIPSALGQ